MPQVTLDEYCCTEGIARIDLLKTDTEGWDVQVLRGAQNMLREQRIKLVFSEATPTPSVMHCTGLAELTECLLEFGYRPYMYYDFCRRSGSLCRPIDFMNVLYVPSDASKG